MKIFKKIISVCVSSAIVLSSVSFSFCEDKTDFLKNTAIFSDAENTETAELNFTGKYQQTSARNMLSYINNLRSEENAWAWNKDNSQKIYYSGLENLTYDYELEKTAMQRAAELVAAYSHSRPDGTSCFTAYPEKYQGTTGENIAIGTSDLDTVSAFEMWKEENENYSGQGHRRNMLDADYKSVGIAHVYYKGCHYWVQEFSSADENSDFTQANDSDTQMSVKVNLSSITSDTPGTEYTSVAVKVGETNNLPQIYRQVRLSEMWESAPSLEIPVNALWNVSMGDDIVNISNGKYTCISEGFGTLTAEYNGSTADVKIQGVKDSSSFFKYYSYGGGIVINDYSGDFLNLTIPAMIGNKNVLIIDSYALCAKSMQTINISEGIESLKRYAFYGCDKVKEVTIPQSVTEMGEKCMGYDCYGEKLSEMKIKCYENSAGEKYAIENGFQYEILSPHTKHSYNEEILTASSCTSTGTAKYTCEICGKAYIDTIPKLSHKYAVKKVTDPTCDSEGYTEYECEICGDTKKDDYKEKLEHINNCTVVLPTCTNQGYTLYECKLCGNITKGEFTQPTGHSYGEYETTKEPTETENGTEVRICKNCGEHDIHTIPKLEHDYEIKVIAPTCKEIGYTIHTCKICGDSYTDNYKEKLDHDYGQWEITSRPTCEKQGIKTRKCSKCNSEQTENIPKSEHNYTVEVKSPTCSEKGCTLHTCKTCGYSFTDNETEMISHNYGEWKTTSQPTCEKTGTQTRKCLSCGAIQSKTLPVKSHSYKTEIIKPDCENQGYTLHICTTCKKTYKSDFVKSAGHKYITRNIPSDYKNFGYTLHKCEKCGKSYKSDFKPMLVSIKSVKLSGLKTSYTYTGKNISPKITLKYGSEILKKDKDYTVILSSNRNCGTAKIIVRGKGKVKGAIVRYFKIIPSQTKLLSVKSLKNSFKVSFKRMSAVSGYQLQYSSDSDFKRGKIVTLKGKNNSVYTIKQLKSKKKYYIRVRAFVKNSKKTFFSKWSNSSKTIIK